jgi:phage shock protein A
MRVAEMALGRLAGEDEPIVELRRDAVAAVVLHQRLREELAVEGAKAAFIEARACRALGRGDDALARRILAQGICTLKTRDALEQDADHARRAVSDALFALIRAENQAWRQQNAHQAAAGCSRPRPGSPGTIHNSRRPGH